MRLGNHMTGITPKAAAIATLVAVALGAPARARADSTGIVVVTGKVSARERATIDAAITTVLRKASWSLNKPSLAPRDIQTITSCLRDDKPWSCLRPVMEPIGVDRIVVADANPSVDSPTKLLITGEFVVAGDVAPAVVQRRCDGCDDTGLAAVAQTVAEELLHDMAMRSETVLELHTVPHAAAVSLDGQSIGTTDADGVLVHTTIPGPHKLVVRHTGFATDERTIDLPPAKTTPLRIELSEIARRRSRVGPIALAAGGAVALGVGGVFIYLGQQGGPDDRYIYTRATSIGIGTCVVGAAAIAGAYLWWRGSRTSGVAMIPTRGGVVAGWAGAF